MKLNSCGGTLRAWLVACLAAASSGIVADVAPAAQPDAKVQSQQALITPQTADAIRNGLEFLADSQIEDGSFGPGASQRNVAVCALGGMAFLAQGSTPGRGTYGEHVDRCIAYLVEHTTELGLIAAEADAMRGPMYGQGFATLFLCECYGMSDHPALRDRLSAAVELILRAQNPEGGWRYTPEPRDADLSVTVCEVMALRAARNAGIAVPKEAIDRSIEYVKRCQNEDGGFRYMLTSGPPVSGFARTAAGVVALNNAGIYKGPEIERGMAYLHRFPPGTPDPQSEAYYYYAHYYAVQALWHAGGEAWENWYPAIRDDLLARQTRSGSWLDSVGSEYATAMACIVLQTPNNYLPILQR